MLHDPNHDLLPPPAPKPIDQLDEMECRFPIERVDDIWLFCGAAIPDAADRPGRGAHYCLEHAKLCYGGADSGRPPRSLAPSGGLPCSHGVAVSAGFGAIKLLRPSLIDYDRCAHLRMPMDMIFFQVEAQGSMLP